MMNGVAYSRKHLSALFTKRYMLYDRLGKREKAQRLADYFIYKQRTGINILRKPDNAIGCCIVFMPVC